MDQGPQFTLLHLSTRFLKKKIKVSWDSRERAMNNIFIEKIWRSLKYDEIYLKKHRELEEARESISKYFD